MYEYLKNMMSKINAIEKHVIELDVKMHILLDSNMWSMAPLGTLDVQELSKFGLPVESELDLNNLEEKLKDVGGFREDLVSLMN